MRQLAKSNSLKSDGGLHYGTTHDQITTNHSYSIAYEICWLRCDPVQLNLAETASFRSEIIFIYIVQRQNFITRCSLITIQQREGLL
jgi:hypothetical protein